GSPDRAGDGRNRRRDADGAQGAARGRPARPLEPAGGGLRAASSEPHRPAPFSVTSNPTPSSSPDLSRRPRTSSHEAKPIGVAGTRPATTRERWQVLQPAESALPAPAFLRNVKAIWPSMQRRNGLRAGQRVRDRLEQRLDAEIHEGPENLVVMGRHE